MGQFDYKVREWSNTDGNDPIDEIKAGTSGDWDYYDSISIHPGRIDLIFRRPADTTT